MSGKSQTGEQMLMAGIEEGDLNDDKLVSFQFLQNGSADLRVISLKIDEHGQVPKSKILLDNQLTVDGDVFHNASLLRNIPKGKGHMDIHCNAGVKSTHIVGNLTGYNTALFGIIHTESQTPFCCHASNNTIVSPLIAKLRMSL
jgi:hypothetical protein